MERIGHRGAKREFPENTLPAFRRAYERGANAVELDVHATSDGVVVVHHDPSVHGPDGRLLEIASTPLSVLRTVRFDGDAGIPTLAEVLDETPPNATVYVEIKGTHIEHAVVECIRRCRATCAIHSFDHDAIVCVKDLAPEIPRGILFEVFEVFEVLEDRSTDVLAAMRRTEARDVWPNWKLIDAELVKLVKGAGGRVIAWTVNDPAVAKSLAALGVDGLCGDDVRLLDLKST